MWSIVPVCGIICRLGQLHDAVDSFTCALKLDQFFTDAIVGRGNAFLEFDHDTGYLLAK